MLIPIVDEQDNIVTYKERDQLEKGDLYRGTALMVVDQDNKVLLTRRALTKKKSPWKRTIAVAWTVEKWETYEDNIVKETKEELGVELGNHKELGCFRSGSKKDHFLKVFLAMFLHDTPFIFDPTETIDSKWVGMDELSTLIIENPEVFVSFLVDYREKVRLLCQNEQ